MLSAGFLKNVTGRVMFSSWFTAEVSCTFILLHVDSFLLNMFGNFGTIFFQAVLVRCFVKERILTKQDRDCNFKHSYFQEILRREILSLL